MSTAKEEDFTKELREKGYVVVPVVSASEADALRHDLVDAVTTGPEHTEAARRLGALLVGGGFGGLGNPSSFHHLCIRKLRRRVWKAVVENAVIPLPTQQYALSMVFDRVGYRLPGQAPTRESWHRDQPGRRHAPLKPGEALYGGWLSLTEGQEFWCAPGTHNAAVGHGGFHTRLTPEELAEAKAKRTCVKVPKGYLLIFNENLLHEVVSKRSPDLMVRLFMGWVVSAPGTTEPRIPGTEATIETQAVPELKSGQTPPMVPAMYVNQLRTNQGRIDRIVECYKPAACSTQQIGPKAKYQGRTGDGTYTAPYRARPNDSAGKQGYKPRVMLSLAKLTELDPTISMHPPYTPEDRALFVPRPNPYGSVAK